ncbi:MAG: hypothetical protein KA015_04685 [Spirochaetes bacterium]|nr:hypothetical protein [Spirochaetota bacterium]
MPFRNKFLLFLISRPNDLDLILGSLLTLIPDGAAANITDSSAFNPVNNVKISEKIMKKYTFRIIINPG